MPQIRSFKSVESIGRTLPDVEATQTNIFPRTFSAG
jgi:hypothetical protein